MSAPDTNIDKQAERHKSPLIGMPAAIILALVAILAFAFYVTQQDDLDMAAPEVIEGSGAVVVDDGS